MGLSFSLETPGIGESRGIRLELEMGLSQAMSGNTRKFHDISLTALFLPQRGPRGELKLSAFELYGRPIPQIQKKGHLNPLEMEQLKYVLQVSETRKVLMEYGNQMLPAPTELPPPLPARSLGTPQNLENL